MNSNKKNKIEVVILEELSLILQSWTRDSKKVKLISVSKVSITPDFSIAKVYISIFPFDLANEVLSQIEKNSSKLKHSLAQRLKNRTRKTPDLRFYLDDSLDYIENIEKNLDSNNRPIL